MPDSLWFVIGLIMMVVGYWIGRWAGYSSGWEDAMLHAAMVGLYRAMEGDE